MTDPILSPRSPRDEVHAEMLAETTTARHRLTECLRNDMAECLHVSLSARHPRSHPYGRGGGTPNACSECIANADMMVEFVTAAATDDAHTPLRWRGVWE